jgi:hypothetical protein
MKMQTKVLIGQSQWVQKIYGDLPIMREMHTMREPARKAWKGGQKCFMTFCRKHQMSERMARTIAGV